jgi:uncharacterized RDD family membrane protein YckC
MNRANPGQLYARAAPRLQAYLRDFLVYMAILVSCMVAAVAVGSPRATQASVITYIVFVLLYEPVCIAVAGGTIGHLSLNLRIVRVSDLGRVSFGRALVRTVVKGLIGLPVFLAIYFTRKCQGIHDLVAGTVVVPRDAAAVPPRGFVAEKARVRIVPSAASGVARP